MKGLACGKCIDLRAFPRQDFQPITCSCGNVAGWWVDGKRGEARYHSPDRAFAFGVGFDNKFLIPALSPNERPSTDEGWRQLHDLTIDAPGYLFNRTRRASWVIVFKPGEASGVEWANPHELHAVGLGPPPDSEES